MLSLSRTREEDVDAALRAIDQAKKPGIHIFIATSDIHLKYKLNMTREDVLNARDLGGQPREKAFGLYRILV